MEGNYAHTAHVPKVHSLFCVPGNGIISLSWMAKVHLYQLTHVDKLFHAFVLYVSLHVTPMEHNGLTGRSAFHRLL